MRKRNDISGSIDDLILYSYSFVTWARELNVPLRPNNNWIEKAIRRIEQLLCVSDEEKRRKLFNSLYASPVESQYNISDLMLLAFIKENIGIQDKNILRDKLSLATRGADSAYQESNGNTAFRDALFELAFCARLNERRFKAKLTDSNPDIIVKRKKIIVAVECKRLFSEARLEKLIKEAAYQLRFRPQNQRADIRAVACNVTRYLTKGKLHLQGNVSQVQTYLMKEMDNIALKVTSLLEKENWADVDAVILTYMDYIEVTDGAYKLTNISQHTVIINPVTTNKRQRKAQRIFSKLGPPTPSVLPQK